MERVLTPFKRGSTRGPGWPATFDSDNGVSVCVVLVDDLPNARVVGAISCDPACVYRELSGAEVDFAFQPLTSVGVPAWVVVVNAGGRNDIAAQSTGFPWHPAVDLSMDRIMKPQQRQEHQLLHWSHIAHGAWTSIRSGPSQRIGPVAS
jgi:hypothetical protein